MLSKYKPDVNDVADHYEFYNDSHGRCGYFDIFTEIREEKTFSVWNLGITTEARGNGFGQQMLKECINVVKSSGAKRLVLSVAKNNLRAQHIYTKFGFVKTEERSYSYRMELSL